MLTRQELIQLRESAMEYIRDVYVWVNCGSGPANFDPQSLMAAQAAHQAACAELAQADDVAADDSTEINLRNLVTILAAVQPANEQGRKALQAASLLLHELITRGGGA